MRNKIVRAVSMLLGAGVLLTGCDGIGLQDPPLAITFRQGVLSRLVMQISNLSNAKGVEVYVYVADNERSVRSGNTVVPANGKFELGSLEIDWNFKVGDKGFVCAPRYVKKLFFEMGEGSSYRTWFGLDDIPEIDVGARVRAFKEEKRLAKLSEDIRLMGIEAMNLYAAITNTDVLCHAEGAGGAWPRAKVKAPLVERTKAKLTEWKGKIVGKLSKSGGTTSGKVPGDLTDMRFVNSSDYFAWLFKEEGMSMFTNWSVIAEYNGSISPMIPVLVSANLPCESLCAMWDGSENEDVVIPLQNVGTLGTNAVVIVYGNGDVRTLEAENLTRGSIYGRAFNTCTNGYNKFIQYLTPRGVVRIDVPSEK